MAPSRCQGSANTKPDPHNLSAPCAPAVCTGWVLHKQHQKKTSEVPFDGVVQKACKTPKTIENSLALLRTEINTTRNHKKPYILTTSGFWTPLSYQAIRKPTRCPLGSPAAPGQSATSLIRLRSAASWPNLMGNEAETNETKQPQTDLKHIFERLQTEQNTNLREIKMKQLTLPSIMASDSDSKEERSDFRSSCVSSCRSWRAPRFFGFC